MLSILSKKCYIQYYSLLFTKFWDFSHQNKAWGNIIIYILNMFLQFAILTPECVYAKPSGLATGRTYQSKNSTTLLKLSFVLVITWFKMYVLTAWEILKILEQEEKCKSNTHKFDTQWFRTFQKR